MHAPQNPDAGFITSGSIRVVPPLTADQIEVVNTIATTGFHSYLEDRSSTLVETLAPGHPDGVSGWIACPEGCCIELIVDLPVQPESIEPWLSYLVGSLFAEHAFSGAVVLWDAERRSFEALTIEGTRVRRETVLDDPTARRRRAGASRARSGPRAIRSV